MQYILIIYVQNHKDQLFFAKLALKSVFFFIIFAEGFVLIRSNEVLKHISMFGGDVCRMLEKLECVFF